MTEKELMEIIEFAPATQLRNFMDKLGVGNKSTRQVLEEFAHHVVKCELAARVSKLDDMGSLLLVLTAANSVGK